MKDFLKDNWLWILLPFLAVVAVVAYVVFVPPGDAPPMTYGQ